MMICFLLLVHGAFASAQFPRLFDSSRGDDFHILLVETDEGPHVIVDDHGQRTSHRARPGHDRLAGEVTMTYGDPVRVLVMPDLAPVDDALTNALPRLIGETGRIDLVENSDADAVNRAHGLWNLNELVKQSQPQRTLSQTPPARPSAANRAGALVHFVLDNNAAADQKIAAFAALAPDIDRWVYEELSADAERREVMMWVASDEAGRLGYTIREYFGESPTITRNMDHIQARVLLPQNDRAIKRATLTERWANLKLFISSEAWRLGSDASVIERIRADIFEIERLVQQVDDVLKRLTGYTHSAAARTEIQRKFRAPLIAGLRQAFQTLHQMGEFGIREILYGWPARFGFPQTYLEREIAVGDKTYFGVWLFDLVYASQNENQQLETRQLKNLAVIKRTFFGNQTLNLGSFVTPSEAFSTWPTFALGLKNGDNARDDLVSVLLTYDQIGMRMNAEVPGVDGSLKVSQILEAIAQGARRSFDSNYAGFTFAPAPYLARAASLFSELLEDNRHRPLGGATHKMVLANAARLVREIEREYPGGNAHRADADAGGPRLGHELDRLRDALWFDPIWESVATADPCSFKLQL